MLARSHGYSGSTGNWSTHNYYHADAGGNITCLINSNNGITASYRYDPFGRTLFQSGTMANANVYRFSSKEVHGFTGMYYYGFRFYDPGLQRWINRDPIGEVGGLNLYGFVGNSPVYYIDAYGLYTWGERADICGAFFSGLWDGVVEDMRESNDFGTFNGEPVRGGTPPVPGIGRLGHAAKQLGGAAKRKAILLGENMKDRVIPIAIRRGMDYYKPRSKIRENWFMNNMRWIRNRIKEGREFFTVGRDPKRVPDPNRRDYYGGELNELNKANCPVKELP